MKKSISLGVILALAIVPASAFGVAIDLSSGTASLEQGTSGTISVSVDLDPEGLSLTGISYVLQASVNDAFDIQSRTLTGTLADPTTAVVNDLPLNPTNGQDLGSTWDTVTAQTADETTATILVDYDLTSYVDGNVLTIGLVWSEAGSAFAPRYSTAAGAGFATATGLSIDVTPEPASLLLLLAAAPLALRRRRA